jgi:hypothetical protein
MAESIKKLGPLHLEAIPYHQTDHHEGAVVQGGAK